MTSRSTTTSILGGRAQAQRRLRRTSGRRLFCSTNGCATFLVPDATGGRATCPICGLRRSIGAELAAVPTSASSGVSASA